MESLNFMHAGGVVFGAPVALFLGGLAITWVVRGFRPVGPN